MAVIASVISSAFILLHAIIAVHLFSIYGLQRQHQISTDSVSAPLNLFYSLIFYHATAAQNSARSPSFLSKTARVRRYARYKLRGVVHPCLCHHPR